MQKDVEHFTRKVGVVELFDRLQYIDRFGGVHLVHWTSSAGPKLRRTARESHENGLWTCPVEQMRLEHFELFFCLTFSISYGSKHIKICA